MTSCPKCLLDLSRNPLFEGGVCPNCGQVCQASREPAAVPIGPGASLTLFGRFLATLRDVIFRPSQFFSGQAAALVSEEGLSSALAFAVIVQWLASFFNFIWRSTIGVVLQSRVNDLFRVAGDIIETKPGAALGSMRDQAIEFFFGAGAIVLTPFATLIKLVLVGLFVHAAVRFFMRETADRPHRYSTTLKILAYASAPWILCVIPGFGIILAWVLAFMASVIGLREVYRTTTTRAVLAVVFPELLFLGFLLAILVLFLFLAFNVMRLVI